MLSISSSVRQQRASERLADTRQSLATRAIDCSLSFTLAACYLLFLVVGACGATFAFGAVRSRLVLGFGILLNFELRLIDLH